MRGDRKTRSGETRDIRDYGADVGLTYLPDLRFDPSLTLGVAFGTGDSELVAFHRGYDGLTWFQLRTGRFCGGMRM